MKYLQPCSKSIPCLHEDIITEILNRVVPVESLYSDLRYVCKPWLKIINNPVFQHNHPVTKEPPCLIIQNMNHSNFTHTLSDEVKSIVEADPFTTSSIQLGEEGIGKQVDLSSAFQRLWIRACCNGLMIVHCFGSPRNIYYLVNFVTKQAVKLPPAACYYGDRTFNKFPSVWFTFIPSTGDYKVVLQRQEEYPSKKKKRSYIQILTFGGNCCSSSDYDNLQWRVVVAPRLATSAFPIAVDEVLYWDIWPVRRTIVCFHAGEEKFYAIPCPGDAPNQDGMNEGLMEMAGYLACWINSRRYQQLDFWILKNFRTREWIKYTSISIDDDIGLRIDMGFLYRVLSYGEVIMFQNLQDGNLLAYNMKSSMWWELGNNLKVLGDHISFCGFHVKKIMPLKSLLEKKQAI